MIKGNRSLEQVDLFGKRKSNIKNDLVTTPEYVTEELLKQEEFKGVVFEPCCGNGRISKVLIREGLNVISSDKIDYGYGEKKNLFHIGKKFDNIITNPPFTEQSKVKKHLLKITRRKLALLWYVKNLGNEMESPNSKYLKSVYIFNQRIKWKETKLGWLFAWYVWDKNFKGNPTIKRIDYALSQQGETKK